MTRPCRPTRNHSDGVGAASRMSKARHVVWRGLCGSATDGIAHESDSGILEQSVHTIKMGVFKLRVHCFASAVGWDYGEVLVACCIVVCHVGCCWPHD